METTGYAVLALLERGDRVSASSAARWLVSQRNAFGGFGSTQDTVVGLQALIQFATHARFDVDMTVNLESGDWVRQVKINETNADLVNVLDVPIGDSLVISTKGSARWWRRWSGGSTGRRSICNRSACSTSRSLTAPTE